MPEERTDPTKADIFTALQRIRRQQRELIQGVERRLGAKIDQVEQRLDLKFDQNLAATEKRLDQKLAATEKRLTERLAQEIQDRPIVVHVDMSRVSELEKRVQDLLRRVAELETRH